MIKLTRQEEVRLVADSVALKRVGIGLVDLSGLVRLEYLRVLWNRLFKAKVCTYVVTWRGVPGTSVASP
jgi:hypothetical protein